MPLIAFSLRRAWRPLRKLPSVVCEYSRWILPSQDLPGLEGFPGVLLKFINPTDQCEGSIQRATSPEEKIGEWHRGCVL